MTEEKQEKRDKLTYFDPEKDIEWFNKKIDNFSAWGKRDECCLWNSSINNKGYGTCTIKGRNCYAHRLSYYIFYKEVPNVCRHAPHKQCGNTHCVNPLHLKNGTQKDNVHDALEDGTAYPIKNHGMLGKSHSVETRKKISDGNKAKWAGKVHPNTGRELSAETRRKMSEAHKGKKLSAETIRKMSEANTGKKLSKESVEKRSETVRKTYKATSPEGVEYITKNLQEFCKTHNLCYAAMTRAARKINKNYKHKGWKCVKVDT